MVESKSIQDFIRDITFSKNVHIGRFKFKNDIIVYSITDSIHDFDENGLMCWYLTQKEYSLLSQFRERYPVQVAIRKEITNRYYNHRLLCSQAKNIGKATTFTLQDVNVAAKSAGKRYIYRNESEEELKLVLERRGHINEANKNELQMLPCGTLYIGQDSKSLWINSRISVWGWNICRVNKETDGIKFLNLR